MFVRSASVSVLPDERLRLQRNELRRCRLLAGHRRSAEQATSWTGNSGLPVSRSSTNVKPIFVSCTTASFAAAPDPIVTRIGRRRIVVVPDVVPDGLEVPLALAGRRVQRQHGVGEQVVALAESAVEVLGRRAGGGEHPAALLVDGDAAPGVGAAVVLPLDPLPGVVAGLALAWESCGKSTSCAPVTVSYARMWPGDAS